MTLVDSNAIQFYGQLTAASLLREKVPKASNAKDPLVVGKWKYPKAPGPSERWSALRGDDPIAFMDMTN